MKIKIVLFSVLGGLGIMSCIFAQTATPEPTPEQTPPPGKAEASPPGDPWQSEEPTPTPAPRREPPACSSVYCRWG